VPVSLSSPHIFVIEKNPHIANMIIWMLKLADYRSTKSEGEQSVLSQISPRDPPALILLDISLPRNPPGKVLTDLQAQYIALGITPPPIVVLATSPIIQAEIQALGYRAVLKPFYMWDLTRTVRQSLSLPSVQP
jgi:DNA-binding response OmpR family regulator